MPRKISNSAITDSEEERRPVAKNMRQVRPKPIPIDKAGLALELLNNQTRPVVNIVGTRHFHENPIPLDKNYPIEIELQRIAMEAVPNKPAFQPLKTKSPFTEDMIEKYREEERRGISQRGYDVPPEIEVIDFEDPREDKVLYATNMVQQKEARARLLRNRYASLVKDVEDINQDSTINETRKQRLLEKLAKGMKNIASEMSGLEQELLEMLEVQKTFKVEEERIKRANAQKIKNAEDQIRLLNNTLPIQQMKGEPDEVYRERLIALRVPTDYTKVDAQEARMFEHKVFKRNLKKLIDLPLYQVDNIIKMLDLNDMERTYQLNEIFPKVESEFIKVFGRKPLLRNPEQTLTDFFASILEAPLVAQEQTEAISALSEQQSVSTGDIDPSLRGLKKAEVLKLLKDAGLTKKRASDFQKMTVNKLKVLYTEHLKKSKTQEEQTQETALQYLGRISKAKEREDEFVRAERKADEEERKAFIKEEKREEGVQAKIGKKETSNFQRTQAFLRQKIAEEEARQAEAQEPKRRGRPPKGSASSGASKEQTMLKFMKTLSKK